MKIRERLARRRRERHRRLHAAIAKEDTLKALDAVWRTLLSTYRSPPATREDAEAVARQRLLELRVAERMGFQVTHPGVPFLRTEPSWSLRDALSSRDQGPRPTGAMLDDPDEGGRRGD